MPHICFQNQLLTKGMVILRDKIRFYEGEWAPGSCAGYLGLRSHADPGLGGVALSKVWKGSSSRARSHQAGRGENPCHCQEPRKAVVPAQCCEALLSRGY